MRHVVSSQSVHKVLGGRDLHLSTGRLLKYQKIRALPLDQGAALSRGFFTADWTKDRLWKPQSLSRLSYQTASTQLQTIRHIHGFGHGAGRLKPCVKKLPFGRLDLGDVLLELGKKQIRQESTTSSIHRDQQPPRKGPRRRYDPKPRGVVKRLRDGVSDSTYKMKSHVQFISTPTFDTPGTALVLHFDDKRYLFGQLHEGLQRASLHTNVRFLKVKDIFISGQTQWSNTGGLLGLILTLADTVKAAAASRIETDRIRQVRKELRDQLIKAEAERREKSGKAKKPIRENTKITDNPEVEEDPTIRIHGGANLTHTLATARSFIFRQGLPVTICEYANSQAHVTEGLSLKPTFEDNRIQVWTIPLHPQTDQGEDPDLRQGSPRKRSLGEFISGQSSSTIHTSNVTNINTSRADFIVKKNIVDGMFRSDWGFDTLNEVRLSEAKLPATLFVRDPESNQIIRYVGPLPNGQNNEPLPDIKVLVRKPWPGALIHDMSPAVASPVSLCYVVRSHWQRGKFRPDQAKALNIPQGHMYAHLAQGKTVTLKDGTSITPDMVLEPGQPGRGVAILDVPSQDYLPSLMNRPELFNTEMMAGIESFIWLLGPGVSGHPHLHSIIDQFKNVKHIISSSEVCKNELTMTAAATEHTRHRLIDPDRFTELQYDKGESASSHAKLKGIADVEIAKKGLQVLLTPESGIVRPEPIEEPAQLKAIPSEVTRMAEQARNESVSTHELEQKTAKHEKAMGPEVICLGTGSAQPSQQRNVSGTLIRVPGCGAYLLDCGEGTFGQLQRIFPAAELVQILKDLKLIWISHLHADHHLGLVSILKAWHKVVHPDESNGTSIDEEEASLPVEDILRRKRQLCIMGHANMIRWLKEYSSVENIGHKHIIPLVVKPKEESASTTSLIYQGIDVGLDTAKTVQVCAAIRQATGLSGLSACHVSHCWGALAVSMTCSNGFKFSYSGDCRPSKHFAQIGVDSDVLIHEATFDDDLAGDAKAKKHSTISEAICVGAAMHAKNILLTHFSQRYAKVPNLSSVDPSIVLADSADDITPEHDLPVDMGEASPQSTNTQLDHEQGGLIDGTTMKSSIQGLSSMAQALTRPNRPPTPINSRNRPFLNPHVKRDFHVGVAFDYMRVKVSDIQYLKNFTAAYQELYKEHVESDKVAAHSDPEVPGELPAAAR